jgi:glycosyltransferase involved in cell wall biosynthesis
MLAAPTDINPPGEVRSSAQWRIRWFSAGRDIWIVWCRDSMRIAHVTDCYLPRIGGIERQVHDLALLQQRGGHDVEVVTSTSAALADKLGDVQVRRPPLRRTCAPGDIRYGWSTRGREAVLTGGFDLVHVHASAFSPLAFLTAGSAASAGIPTVLTAHSLLAYASPMFRAADVLSGWGRWPLAWSAVSSLAAEPLQRIVGPSTPISILPNGVVSTSWRIVPTARRPAKVVIATVGRLAVRKRPQALLKIMQRVRARLPEKTALELVMIGEGPLRPSLERFIHRHDMSRWVRLLGSANHQEIRRVYEGVDFYVAPATLESFGIAALEARCAGLPVVAYAASGIADFIRDDIEGLLARDDDEMVTSILRLAMSPTTLERMRRHNTEIAPTITWPDIIDRCDTLYDEARGIALGVEGESLARATS